jgi:hypothetical protein
MAIYEVDTITQAVKKYAVTLTLGFAIGAGTMFYMKSCTEEKKELSPREMYKQDLERILRKTK